MVYIENARIRSLKAANLAIDGVETQNIAVNAVTQPYSLTGSNTTITNFQTINALTPAQTVTYTAGVVTGNAMAEYQDNNGNSAILELGVQRRFGTSGAWTTLFAWVEVVGLGTSGRGITFGWADPDSTPGVRQYRLAALVTVRLNPSNPINVSITAPNLVTLYHQR